MSETIFSLEEIAEAFKYIQDDKLSTDAKAMLTMDIGYEKAEKDIIKLLEEKLPKTLRLVYEVCLDETGLYDTNEAALVKDAFIALIKGEK